MALQHVRILPRHNLTINEIDHLEDHLYEFNRRAIERDDGLRLGFIAIDQSGAKIGAVAGYSWARMVEIKQLWVTESRRGLGVGRALLEAAVTEAIVRDCLFVWVMSYGFQAPGLYERCGFERVAELPDWPPGHAQIILRRRLPAE